MELQSGPRGASTDHQEPGGPAQQPGGGAGSGGGGGERHQVHLHSSVREERARPATVGVPER